MQKMQPDLIDSYFAAIRHALDSIRKQEILAAAALIAQALEFGGIVHMFGTGHSILLAQEVFHRAGGLVAVNPIIDPRLGFERGAIEGTEFERQPEGADDLVRAAGFRAGDAGVVISNSGRNGLPVEMALRMKAFGMAVVALTNLEQSRGAPSRHPSGKRLFEVADITLDNCCPPGDAAIRVPGMATLLGPLSTITGAALLHATFVEAARLLADKGKPPAAFASANVGAGALEELKALTDPYRDRIRFYRAGGR
jgi:uncharacterized phosphosugar-binding protein